MSAVTERVTLSPGEKMTPAFLVARAAELTRDVAAEVRSGAWGPVPGDRESAAAAVDAVAAYMATMPGTRSGQDAAEGIAQVIASVLTGEPPYDAEDDPDE